MEKLKIFWKKEGLFSVLAVIAVIVFYYSIPLIKISFLTRLLSIIFFVLAVISILLLAAKPKEEKEKKEKEEKAKEGAVFFGGYVQDVPANQLWVLRRTLFGSDVDGKLDKKTRLPPGYFVRKEGLNYKIPIYHDDLGLVDKSPVPKDPERITVNTKDNQTATFDWRKVTCIPDPISAVKFAAKVGPNRDEFENKQAEVIFNRIASRETQAELTEFKQDEEGGKGELENISEEATTEFNKKMKKLGLGLKALALEVKKILPPTEVIAAAEHQTISAKRAEAAVFKGIELTAIAAALDKGQKKDQPRVNRTALIVAEIAREMLTNFFSTAVDIFKAIQPIKPEKDKDKEGGTKNE